MDPQEKPREQCNTNLTQWEGGTVGNICDVVDVVNRNVVLRDTICNSVTSVSLLSMPTVEIEAGEDEPALFNTRVAEAEMTFSELNEVDFRRPLEMSMLRSCYRGGQRRDSTESLDIAATIFDSLRLHRVKCTDFRKEEWRIEGSDLSGAEDCVRQFQTSGSQSYSSQGSMEGIYETSGF